MHPKQPITKNKSGPENSPQEDCPSETLPNHIAPLAPKTVNPKPETVARYKSAVELYASTNLTAKQICEQSGVPLKGFLSYIYRTQRHLLLARHGISCTTQLPSQIQLAGKKGQTPAAHAKYREAIAACDNIAYITLNVSQIAKSFGVSPSGLSNQLRRHYPEIVERREQQRQKQGLADHQRRGMRPQSQQHYAQAIELLQTTEKTIAEVAAICHVSESGLKQHLLFHHRPLLDNRFQRRETAKGCKQLGQLTGNGQRHIPHPQTQQRYCKAEQLYRDTSLSIRAIAEQLNLNRYSLAAYLRTWCREISVIRRSVVDNVTSNLSTAKHYLSSTAAKYAPAIAELKRNQLSTAQIAQKFGLHPDCLRNYLREHYPELYAQQGRIKIANGHTVSRRSMEKYAEAIHLYKTTTDPLHTIAVQLNLNYKSLSNFIRRNFPELIAQHHATKTNQ